MLLILIIQRYQYFIRLVSFFYYIARYLRIDTIAMVLLYCLRNYEWFFFFKYIFRISSSWLYFVPFCQMFLFKHHETHETLQFYLNCNFFSFFSLFVYSTFSVTVTVIWVRERFPVIILIILNLPVSTKESLTVLKTPP